MLGFLNTRSALMQGVRILKILKKNARALRLLRFKYIYFVRRQFHRNET